MSLYNNLNTKTINTLRSLINLDKFGHLYVGVLKGRIEIIAEQIDVITWYDSLSEEEKNEATYDILLQKKIILITGDRKYDDIKNIKNTFEIIRNVFTSTQYLVVHGAATGADTLAGDYAEKIGYTVKKYPAEWDKYSTAAGPIRNKQMIDMNPSVILIFHKDLKNSKGTADCVKRAIRTDKNFIFLLEGIPMSAKKLNEIFE